MIVVDPSILANALADDQLAGEAARGELRAADQVTAPIWSTSRPCRCSASAGWLER